MCGLSVGCVYFSHYVIHLQFLLHSAVVSSGETEKSKDVKRCHIRP